MTIQRWFKFSLVSCPNLLLMYLWSSALEGWHAIVRHERGSCINNQNAQIDAMSKFWVFRSVVRSPVLVRDARLGEIAT
jgi:hypothetical protein